MFADDLSDERIADRVRALVAEGAVGCTEWKDLAAASVARQSVRARLLAHHHADDSLGASTSLAEGFYWQTVSADTETRWDELPQPEMWGSTIEDGKVRLALQLLVMVQSTFTELAPIAAPWQHFRVGNAYGLVVQAGFAVGYISVHDDFGDGTFETISSIWTARGKRRQGIATDLVGFALTQTAVSITGFSQPISAAALVWGRKVAATVGRPDMEAQLEVADRLEGAQA